KRRRVEQGADDVGLFEFLQRKWLDAVADARPAEQSTFLYQPVQRFPQWRAAHPQSPRQVYLVDAFPGWQSSVQDAVAQFPCQRVTEIVPANQRPSILHTVYS